jgi:AcrR family transcriptional regulator
MDDPTTKFRIFRESIRTNVRAIIGNMSLYKLKKSRETKKDTRSSKGAETKRKILAYAMGIAAREGLAGLTIGRLARDLGMSKSGLFAHFRSKRSLEMATINEARNVFASQVLSPAKAANDGIEQLWVLCNSWLAHIERRVFPGGYFFTGAFFECAERSGSIEDEINRMAQEWWETLKNAVQKAQDHKEINSDVDARRISFDLNGTLIAAYWAYLAEKNEEVFDEARSALFAKMRSLATARIPDYAFKSENAWKEYLERRHVNNKEKPQNIFGRVGRKESQSPTTSSSALSQSKQPPKKSGSVFDGLRRLTQR